MRGAEQQAAACQRTITAGGVGHSVGTLRFAEAPGALHQVPAWRPRDVLIRGEPRPLRKVREGTRGRVEEGTTFYCRVRREGKVH